jgi:acyl transferase domain-containing protein
VSSFGIGGTNAHVVLEEKPDHDHSHAGGVGIPILTLSARNSLSLRQMRLRLAGFLAAHTDVNLFDVAYTLHVGRQDFEHRFALVSNAVPDAISSLLSAHHVEPCQPGQRVAFLFAGQGTNLVNAGRPLLNRCFAFREQMDECCKLGEAYVGFDLRTVLYPQQGETARAESFLLETAVAQPALFVLEYALASSCMRWGVQPAVMLGHSLGEYVAACLAGVFSLEDALRVVAFRGRVMQEADPGAMLAVGLPVADLTPHLAGRMEVAAVNASTMCTVAGPTKEIDDLEGAFNEQQIFCRRLRTKFAFHSASMDSAVPRLVQFLRGIPMKPPRSPFISGVTGECITPAQATSAEYWGEQMRRTVMFAQGIASTQRMGCRTFLEIGPNNVLTQLVHSDLSDRKMDAFALLFASAATQGADQIEEAVAKLWLRGGEIDWDEYHRGDPRYRLGLPTYCFNRRRYWLDPVAPSNNGQPEPVESEASARQPASTGDIEPDAIAVIERQISVMQAQLECWRQTTALTGPAQ